LCDGTIQGDTIAGNSAHWGGGLYGGGGTIENNTITGNSAAWGGALAYCDGTVQNNEITGNTAEENGGGLDHCSKTIQNNTICGNSAGQDGGGLADCIGTVRNNTITRNTAEEDGGGLYWCSGTIQNNTICGNSAGRDGGALADCIGTVRNNTITRNTAEEDGGGLWGCSGILNCVVWGNTSVSGKAQIYGWSEPTYCCIQDWTGGGEGNITDDPQFVDPDGADGKPETYEDNNYRLSADSPCIDAGNNEDWMWTVVDLDGNPRIWNGTVDMGAYEFGSFHFKIVGAVKAMSGGAELTWSSRPGHTYAVWSTSDPCNKASWIEETTVPSAGETTTWTDPDTASKLKFYKIELK
jgi:hypothetical protein